MGLEGNGTIPAVYSKRIELAKHAGMQIMELVKKDIKPREGEIAQVEWVPLEQVENSLTHENDKVVFRSAMKKLQAEECEAKG